MKEIIKPGYIIEVSNQEDIQYFIANVLTQRLNINFRKL